MDLHERIKRLETRESLRSNDSKIVNFQEHMSKRLCAIRTQLILDLEKKSEVNGKVNVSGDEDSDVDKIRVENANLRKEVDQLNYRE